MTHSMLGGPNQYVFDLIDECLAIETAAFAKLRSVREAAETFPELQAAEAEASREWSTAQDDVERLFATLTRQQRREYWVDHVGIAAGRYDADHQSLIDQGIIAPDPAVGVQQ